MKLQTRRTNDSNNSQQRSDGSRGNSHRARWVGSGRCSPQLPSPEPLFTHVISPFFIISLPQTRHTDSADLWRTGESQTGSWSGPGLETFLIYCYRLILFIGHVQFAPHPPPPDQNSVALIKAAQTQSGPWTDSSTVMDWF